MSSMLPPAGQGEGERRLAVSVAQWGVARLTLADMAPLRKAIPDWAPEDTSGHFFKYADEQTIAAVQALDAVFRSHGGRVDSGEQWGVVTAPRFLGRVSGTAMLVKFAKNGAPGVSPHTIPQGSLHSVSGALSILLDTHAPNVGVGGGPDAFAEGLLAAATVFDEGKIPGAWFVATEWDPEPTLDPLGKCTNEPACYALAMALRPGVASDSEGRLEWIVRDAAVAAGEEIEQEIRVSEVVRCLAGDASGEWSWSLGWGAEVRLWLPVNRSLQIAAA